VDFQRVDEDLRGGSGGPVPDMRKATDAKGWNYNSQAAALQFGQSENALIFREIP